MERDVAVSEQEVKDFNHAVYETLKVISGYELHVCLGAMTQVMAILLVAGDKSSPAEKSCDIANSQLRMAVKKLKKSGEVVNIAEVVQVMRSASNERKH